MHARTARKTWPRFTAAAVLIVCGAAAALAQDGNAPATPPPPETPTVGFVVPPELEPFERRPVASVVLRPAEGSRGADGKPLEEIDADLTDLVRNQLRLREGMPFSAQLVNQDMSRLNRLGRFRRVESSVQQLADGSVTLIYTLLPQPIVRDVQTVGNKAITDQELGRHIDLLVGTPMDTTRIDRAARRIEAAYRDKGYYNARVTIDEEELEENGNVYFRVREGEKTRISQIRFEGNVSFSARELKSTIRTRESLPILRRGQIDDEMLSDDVAALLAYYRDRGYLDARVDRVVTPSADGREAVVTFIIDEGPVYTLRDVRIVFGGESDEKVFTVEQVRGLMIIKPGDVYSEVRLRRSLTALRDAYGKMGFVNATVNRREQRDLQLPKVDILVVINEGRAFRTGEVIVKGNTTTEDGVVRRQVQVQPDRPLDSTAIEETRRRLALTRLFAAQPPDEVKVTLQPERPEDPGFRDVLIEVNETNTGSFNVGGAVSSDMGVAASISLTQRNFDITDTPDTFADLFTGEAFRGAGQTFSITLMPGNERQVYTVALSDPYLFETDFSGSVSAYYYTRRFRGYDETRIGSRFSVGRRLGSQWSLNFPMRVEQVSLGDIDDNAPTDYFAVEDARILASGGVTLGRTSLDDPSFPSKGTKVEVGIDQTFGDETFNTIRAEYSTYARLFEDVLGRRTVLQLTAKTAYIPQDTDDVPFYDRLYLGGQNFRGFALRAVAPVGIRNDNGEISDRTVGGNFMFFMGAELRQPIYEDIVSGVLFVDSGTVDTDVAFDKYRVSVGFGLRVLVRQLSPVPLAFDFGFPIMKEETDEERFFTFSIDVPFN
jgi:outer membrane protein insertion porin family